MRRHPPEPWPEAPLRPAQHQWCLITRDGHSGTQAKPRSDTCRRCPLERAKNPPPHAYRSCGILISPPSRETTSGGVAIYCSATKTHDTALSRKRLKTALSTSQLLSLLRTTTTKHGPLRLRVSTVRDQPKKNSYSLPSRALCPRNRSFSQVIGTPTTLCGTHQQHERARLALSVLSTKTDSSLQTTQMYQRAARTRRRGTPAPARTSRCTAPASLATGGPPDFLLPITASLTTTSSGEMTKN